jgi:hypothetical protein
MRKHVLVLTTTATILTCGAIAASAQAPGTQPTQTVTGALQAHARTGEPGLLREAL